MKAQKSASGVLDSCLREDCSAPASGQRVRLVPGIQRDTEAILNRKGAPISPNVCRSLGYPTSTT
jgi:hypothetical protein